MMNSVFSLRICFFLLMLFRISLQALSPENILSYPQGSDLSDHFVNETFEKNKTKKSSFLLRQEGRTKKIAAKRTKKFVCGLIFFGSFFLIAVLYLESLGLFYMRREVIIFLLSLACISFFILNFFIVYKFVNFFYDSLSKLTAFFVLSCFVAFLVFFFISFYIKVLNIQYFLSWIVLVTIGQVAISIFIFSLLYLFKETLSSEEALLDIPFTSKTLVEQNLAISSKSEISLNYENQIFLENFSKFKTHNSGADRSVEKIHCFGGYFEHDTKRDPLKLSPVFVRENSKKFPLKREFSPNLSDECEDQVYNFEKRLKRDDVGKNTLSDSEKNWKMENSSVFVSNGADREEKIEENTLPESEKKISPKDNSSEFGSNVSLDRSVSSEEGAYNFGDCTAEGEDKTDSSGVCREDEDILLEDRTAEGEDKTDSSGVCRKDKDILLEDCIAEDEDNPDRLFPNVKMKKSEFEKDWDNSILCLKIDKSCESIEKFMINDMSNDTVFLGYIFLQESKHFNSYSYKVLRKKANEYFNIEEEFAQNFEKRLCERIRNFVCSFFSQFNLNKQATLLKKEFNLKVVSIEDVMKKIISDWKFLKDEYSDLFQGNCPFLFTPFLQKLMKYSCLQLENFNCVDKGKKVDFENIYNDFSQKFSSLLQENDKVAQIDHFLESLLRKIKIDDAEHFYEVLYSNFPEEKFSLGGKSFSLNFFPESPERRFFDNHSVFVGCMLFIKKSFCVFFNQQFESFFKPNVEFNFSSKNLLTEVFSWIAMFRVLENMNNIVYTSEIFIKDFLSQINTAPTGVMDCDPQFLQEFLTQISKISFEEKLKLVPVNENFLENVISCFSQKFEHGSKMKMEKFQNVLGMLEFAA